MPQVPRCCCTKGCPTLGGDALLRSLRFTCVNRLLTQIIFSLTASLRFDGGLTVDATEFQANLVLHWRTHLMLCSYVFSRASSSSMSTSAVSCVPPSCCQVAPATFQGIGENGILFCARCQREVVLHCTRLGYRAEVHSGKLPDGNIVTVVAERSRCPELLFPTFQRTSPLTGGTRTRQSRFCLRSGCAPRYGFTRL